MFVKHLSPTCLAHRQDRRAEGERDEQSPI